MDLSRIDARLLSRPGATKALHEKWGLWSTGWAAGSSPASSRPRQTPSRPTRGATCSRSSATPTASWGLRAEHPESVLPGYYSDGRTWVSVDLDAGLPEDLALGLCGMSYDLVLAKLPKCVRREISDEWRYPASARSASAAACDVR